ncbi:MAG: hypothetical protein A2845_02550 [Candidatus Lloydbacteria bacterium RIFCSPHIGHO2_01_FULL_49_22]|uniref:GGDEF domain-containing protein n=1 Tax=Candidatus Lloydbacteria bacterium RIFCSPHIGHO2_01_FULL_49_22 TaxID=1798658 RepID=A0A1G2CV00_9BACT|nr:MAG: hypothetical protein A2845_02550 [Candidatus Lloydbacteria bacterium RIFCSPHIGHO2_01_FULL_49_22]OGZ10328.1 MAG: hypothetical protein A3C14_02250 [Candidatus Lloydbacteria bacterium RIFCSPHIGHO2_02_FULL_50_18]
MSALKSVVPPEVQVFEKQRTPSISLFQRFLVEARSSFERGGWDALTIFLARTHKQLITDKLTGLFTRDAFFMLIEKIILPRMRRRTLKNGETYGSLVVLDLDRFKSINTAFGHAGGDEVLRVFGRLINDHFRDYDMAGRVGGDEFIVIAEGISSEYIEMRMNELKRSFGRYPWSLDRINDETSEVLMSFSFKVITINDPEKILDLILAADRAVFRMKRERDAKKT